MVLTATKRLKTSTKSQQAYKSTQKSTALVNSSSSAFSPVGPQTIVVEGIQSLAQQNSTPTTQLEIRVISPQITTVVQNYESPNLDPIMHSSLEADLNTDLESEKNLLKLKEFEKHHQHFSLFLVTSIHDI